MRNKSAFPQATTVSYESCGQFHQGLSVKGGLTKREFFAAMALQGAISTRKDFYGLEEILADSAVRLADALLKALEE